MQSRREFLRSAGAVAVGAAIGSLPSLRALGAEPPKKPNIVFLFADQLRAGSISCYGGPVPTPNLDRIAAEGARFTNSISTYPLCSPYRAMLLTGRYPVSTGMIENDIPLKADEVTIAKTLKADGYDTAYIGKWHLGQPTQHQGFDYWLYRYGGGDHFAANYLVDGRKVEADGYEVDWQTDRVLEYLRKPKDKPFCLFVSWLPPHSPYTAPKEWLEEFPLDKIKLPANVQENKILKDLLAAEDHSDLNEKQLKQRAELRAELDSDDEVRKMIQGYYAATACLDFNVGRIMKALDDAGVADDTILVFSSDHGDQLGSHRMQQKQVPFEESIVTPFLLRYPRRVKPGTVTDALLPPIDVMPTLLSLAGVKIPSPVEGIGCADAALGKRSDQHDALLLMRMNHGGAPRLIEGILEWRGVRTKRYTYARTVNTGAWVLYDNHADPQQMHNLINDPKRKKLRDQMERKMQVLLKQAHDEFPEKPL